MIEPDHLDDLTDLARKLAVDDVHGMDGAVLGQVALAARRLREAADRIEVHALGALEDSGHTDREFGMTTAGWFAARADLPSGICCSQVNTARILRHLDVVDQAWGEGAINGEHVKVLIRAANPRIRDQIVAAQGDLLALAEGRVFRFWRDAVRELASRLDQDGPDPTDPVNSTASWGRSGAYAELRGRFAGADAELLEQIIEARTNRLFHAQRSDRERSRDIPDLTRGQLRAQAIVELLREGLGADLTRTKKPAESIHLVLRYHGPVLTNGLPDLHRQHDPDDPDGDGAEPVADLSLADPLWSLTNLNGQHLALEHFDVLLCDCVAHALLVDDDDNPIKLGLAARFASPEQRRLVLIRDGGCAHPGCDSPAAWVDIHHVTRAKDGGRTAIANLVALCRRHHGLTHRKGWSMHATGDGWFFWRTPSGHTYWSQRHGRQRAGPAPPPTLAAAA